LLTHSNKVGHVASASAEAQSAGFDNANAVPAKKRGQKKLSTKRGTIKNRIRDAGIPLLHRYG